MVIRIRIFFVSPIFNIDPDSGYGELSLILSSPFHEFSTLMTTGPVIFVSVGLTIRQRNDPRKDFIHTIGAHELMPKSKSQNAVSKQRTLKRTAYALFVIFFLILLYGAFIGIPQLLNSSASWADVMLILLLIVIAMSLVYGIHFLIIAKRGAGSESGHAR